MSFGKRVRSDLILRNTMFASFLTPMMGAIGYSILYLLLGGGFGGALLIFIVAKALRK